MYYLQSRYYDPEICRFINADDVHFLRLNNNAFAYCENNPVIETDSNGQSNILSKLKKIQSKYLKPLFTKNGIKIVLDRKATIALGIVFLMGRLLGSYAFDISSIKRITKDKIARVIITALPYGSGYITCDILSVIMKTAWINAIMTLILSFTASVVTGGSSIIVSTLLSFVFSYYIPPIFRSLQMVAYALTKSWRSELTLSIISGTSVRFI